MIALNYKVVGDGTPVIILHGLFGSLDNWQTISKKISEHGYKVYTVDQRNHGKSPHTSLHTYSEMAKDLAHFMDNMNLQKSIIIGHSMGGKTAMQFAADFPNRIDKLCVVDIGPKYYPPHHQTILKALHSVKTNQITSRKEAEEAIGQHISEFGIKQFLMKNLDRKDATSFRWKMNLPVLSEQIENVGAEIKWNKPFTELSLFIAGENSDYIIKEDHEGIKTLFPKATIINIKEAGHWVHAEQPEAFTETVLQFLEA